MDFIKRLMNLPNDSREKTLFVAVALCLVCSILVSGSAVMLKDMQESNKALDKKRNILQIAGLMQEGKSIDELFQQIETRVVNLDTGEYVTDIDVQAYDQRKAAGDPAQNIVINKSDDIASIKRRAKHATVYLVQQEGTLKTIILPVHGYGLWSTLYGFMALEASDRRVVGFGFYEHAETPGLGGEVDNPLWKAKWIGKQVYGESNEVIIDIVKGVADKNHPKFDSQVDGLAGATLTAVGVENMLHYWLGQQGFAKYLSMLKSKASALAPLPKSDATASSQVPSGEQS